MALTKLELERIRQEQAGRKPLVDEFTVADGLGVAARIAAETYPPTVSGESPVVFVVSPDPNATPGVDHDLKLAEGLFPNKDPIEVVSS